MTAAVAVISASGTSIVPKRHGFSIESLIGIPEATPSPHRTATPPKSFSVRQTAIKETFREDRHNERERDRHRDRDIDRQREREREFDRHRDSLKERELCDLRDRQCREIEREAELFRERELVLENLRLRDRELRDMKDRELSKERETREFMDSRNGRDSLPHHQRLSPRSASPPSPRTEKSITPQSENRLGLWPGEEFKHILGSLNSGHFDTNSLYQPLRVCNRTLASMGGIPGVGGPPAALAMGIPSHFSHLQMNPLLYNLPRELGPQPHPLLAGRYPGFMNTRYQMGPPPGLLFHPYRKPKRNRTAFSPAQLLHLEQAFEKNHYVVGQERKSLAAKLQLTETQVKVWFQNRRTKHKRMKAEEDGGSSGSQVEGHDGCAEKGRDRSDLAAYVEHEDDDEDDPCTDEEEEEELSVTEEC